MRDTRIPVWGLIERRRQGQADKDILHSLPEMTQEDLTAAWDYAAAHPDEIERSLWENQVCMIEHDGRSVPDGIVQQGRQLGLSDEEIRNAFEPPLSQEVVNAAFAEVSEA